MTKPTRSARSTSRSTLPKNVRRHGDKYRGRVMRSGTLHNSPSFDTTQEAEAWVEHFREAVDNAQASGAPVTLAEAMEIVREDMRTDGARSGTVSFAEGKFKAICCGWPETTAMYRIGPKQVRSYMLHRREEDSVSSCTIRGDLVLLKRLFKVAKREGRLRLSPFDDDKVRMPKANSQRFDYLEQGDVRSMLAAVRAIADDRDKAAWDADVIEFLWLTGIRRTELARLRVRDVDLFRSSISIDGKTGRRVNPMMPDTRNVAARLVAAADSEGFIVSSPKGSERTRAGVVTQLFSRWKTRLNLSIRGGAHAMRHSWATFMARSGVPLLDLMLLGGWSSPAQLSRYYHGTESHLRAALEAAAARNAEAAKTEAAKTEAAKTGTDQ